MMHRRAAGDNARYGTVFAWVAVYVVILIWSGYQPKDRLTWILEVFPALAGAVVLALTYRSFRLTGLVYVLVLIHSVILMVGGHYTYAEVPLFDTIADILGSARNNYDKVGHFAQGFVPALIAREIIIRKQVIRGAGWQFFFIVCFCLGFSAFYELIEWWVALASGESAEAFLGTQGYVWDTQSDMALALLGAVMGLLSLRGIHDRQLDALRRRTESRNTPDRITRGREAPDE
jgi:putative membrane protein